jgi:hypothetical protein
MLTSKDFEEAAKMLAMYQKAGFDKAHGTSPSPHAIASYILAEIFSNSNPKFERGKFYSACKYT